MYCYTEGRGRVTLRVMDVYCYTEGRGRVL